MKNISPFPEHHQPNPQIHEAQSIGDLGQSQKQPVFQGAQSLILGQFVGLVGVYKILPTLTQKNLN